MIGVLRTLTKRTIIVITVVYVDDFIITGNDINEVGQVQERWRNKSEIKELGTPNKFFGF